MTCDQNPGVRLKPWHGRSSQPAWQILALLAALLFFAPMPGALAQGKSVSEYELKAAFISKFPLFVKWPAPSFASSNSPIVIGVLGKNPFGSHLEAALRGKVVDNRPLLWKVCGTVEEAATCQIVFVSESEKEGLDKILQQLGRRKILTVSDLPGFAERGGMLGLGEANRKIRLEVNLESVQTSGLWVDPQLLQLSKVIRGGTPK